MDKDTLFLDDTVLYAVAHKLASKIQLSYWQKLQPQSNKP